LDAQAWALQTGFCAPWTWDFFPDAMKFLFCNSKLVALADKAGGENSCPFLKIPGFFFCRTNLSGKIPGFFFARMSLEMQIPGLAAKHSAFPARKEACFGKKKVRHVAGQV
jgi:hypothetical protein